MGKTVAILQPNYIPWRGYFDLLSRVDEFIVYDDAQYTRRDWRNRNKVVVGGAPSWLSIPVESAGHYDQLICDVKLSDPRWQRRHQLTLQHAYAKAPYFEEVMDLLSLGYGGKSFNWLLDANMYFLESIAGYLGIATRMSFASDYGAGGSKTEKLVEMCLAAGADHYLSGPSAKAYIDPCQFDAANMALSYIEYPTYPLFGHVSAYHENMSIVDALMHCGRGVAHHLANKRLIAAVA